MVGTRVTRIFGDTPVMGAHRRRTQFAVPFIAVLGCGGRQTPEERPDVPGPTWQVWGYGDECEAHAPMGSCPKGALCNPPPPSPIECPAGHKDGDRHRIVKRPDATCAIVPEGCTELACATQATPCPEERGAPRKLRGTFFQVTRGDSDCAAREDTCSDASCTRAIECPPTMTAPVRIVESRHGCFLVPDGCNDTSCASPFGACPAAAGKDLDPLKWLGQRTGDACTVTSKGPIAGERVQKIVCPTKAARFQIDRPSRAEPCVLRAGPAPAVDTPCPPP